jgi:type IV pilus assembly protein PilC
MKTKTIGVFEAMTLAGEQKTGIFLNTTRHKIKKELRQKGYFKIETENVARELLKKPLSNNQLLQIINPLIMMLNSGLTLIEALGMQISDNPSLLQKYIYLHLQEGLNSGKDIKASIAELDPLFPEFFKTLVGISETSGELLTGFKSLKTFYTKKEERSREIKKITRYPKIVAIAALLLTFGVILFIIPMFSGIYAMFDNELPIVTNMMLKISNLVLKHPIESSAFGLGLMAWFFIPVIKHFNPFFFLVQKLSLSLQTRDDPFVYSQAMSMLLENGQSLTEAAVHASSCLSGKNSEHGTRIIEFLDSGSDLTGAYRKSEWFPPVFQRILASAERSGQLVEGFFQISQILEQQKEEQFAKWNKLIEPVMMAILGGVILTILLSVYLPIFDLGNQLG